jgi:protein CLEC16A
MFLDMFEDEYRQMQMNPVRLEYLLKDACMLCQPTTTPLSGVEFIKRLPSGDIERARRVRMSVMECKVSFCSVSGDSSVLSTPNTIF